MKLLMAMAIFLLSLSFLGAEEKVGSIVLVGGGSIPPECISWMKNKCQSDKIVVVTLYKERGQRWKDFFGEPIFFLPEELKIEDLNGVGGLVIDGGDQYEYIQRLNGKVVNEAHRRGICILGTSAGSMVLPEHYFSAEEGSISSEEAIAGQHICLGRNFVSIPMLKNTFVESHYTERNRQGRLKIFMEKSGAKIGLGIDENTALCMYKNNRDVFGVGTVSILTNDKVEVLCKK